MCRECSWSCSGRCADGADRANGVFNDPLIGSGSADILLGGNPEGLALEEAHRRGVEPETNRDEYEKILEQKTAECAAEREKVRELGGLCIIGTERHESRRIDNQLRGRSGRQGDPGRSKFFLSLQDDLMRIFGSDRMKNLMETLGLPDDMPIENKMVTSSIAAAQRTPGCRFVIALAQPRIEQHPGPDIVGWDEAIASGAARNDDIDAIVASMRTGRREARTL